MIRRGAGVLTCVAQLVGAPVYALEPPAPPVTSGTEAEPSMPEGEAMTREQAVALAHFRAGKRHYDEGRYAEAAEAFAQSLAAVWTINAMCNMAIALDRAGDAVAALRTYREYLARAEPNDPHRPAALARSERLRERVGEVLLQLDSAEKIRAIRINGEDVALDAFPWLTLPGPLEVEFIGEAPGQRRTIRADVRAGGTATIVFPGFVGPLPLPPDPPSTTKPSAPPPKPSRRLVALRAGFWTSTALTIAGGAAVAAFGSLTLREKRWVERGGCDGVCTLGDTPDVHYENFERYKLATNVAVGLTAALGLTALVLGVALRQERARNQASTRAGLRWRGSAVELTF
ncbi:MAG TPA: tetratricopeptide repeat protein [Nannocystis sp.]